MTGSDMFREIGNIKEEYVVEAEYYRRKVRESSTFRRTLAAAASLLLCLGVVSAVQRLNVGKDSASFDAATAYNTREESVVMEMAPSIALVTEEKEEADTFAGNANKPETSVDVKGNVKEERQTDELGASSQIESAIGTMPMWELKSIKKCQAAYGDNYDEIMKQENAFVILHGEVRSGQHLWEDFLDQVEDGQTAQIDIVNFTVEGDPIIETIHYDGSSFHICVDNSRDAYAGRDNMYYEAEYKFLQHSEKTIEGGRVIEYVLTDSEEDVFKAGAEAEKDKTDTPDDYRIVYIVE